ncbi:DGQHR domain-containing protein [Echinicola shivajiensis]|uniref:DGQHR domain-containing protein n=1 Tax=Echinicola shivajiensis TaxID=1035916 RepID=UPI001BFC4BAF|nr:DGQHR domain-containing protein [Echinicola shivajiensis]
MNSLENNIIKAIPVVQNKQDFLIGVFTIDQILKFTKYTNRLIVSFNEENQPIYNEEIQREVEQSRVKKIADFLIDDPEATFPTNIVLHIPIEVIESQELKGDIIEIQLNNKVFEEIIKEKGDVFISIIDGQHRIRGIEVAIERLEQHIISISQTNRNSLSHNNLSEKYDYYVNRLEDLKNIQLVVSFFIDKSLEYQAMIFSTINRTQKRVSQNLVYSLFGLTTQDSPQKTSLQCVLALNGHEASPFYKRVKFYGASYDRRTSPPLSQATMVRSIVNLISENLRESERDRFKKRKDLLKRTPGSEKFLPFRNLYATDQDSKISDLLYYYFSSVEDIFRDSSGNSFWFLDPSNSRHKNIFHTSVGFDSLLKIFVQILEENQNMIETANKDLFDSYMIRATHLNIGDVNRYSFNNRGKKILFLDLNLSIWPSNNYEDKRLIELNQLLDQN